MPLSRAGIIAGSMLVFIPCVGEYVIPELLGGPQTQMIGRTLWDEFFSNNDWPMACAVAVVMVLLIIVPLALFSRYQAERRSGDLSATPCAGHGRARPLVRPRLAARSASCSCTCRSSRWCFSRSTIRRCQRLARLHAQVVRARSPRPRAARRPGLSLKIAFVTATASVVLGTLAAFALVRYRRFHGRTLFAGMVAAPLVMPEVIIGLSLLLMLVSVQRATPFGFPERGMLTIWLGHLLLGMAYATVVVQARLQTLNAQLEEAAMDLGARPWQVFQLVTLPMIAQSLLSAWLLTFTLSLDDVVLSAFLSGPGCDDDAAGHLLARAARPQPERERGRHADRAVVSIGVVVASWLIARSERRRTRDVAAAAQRAAGRAGMPRRMTRRAGALGAYLCLAASMAIVGTYVGLSKALVAVFPVFLLAWLRFGIAAVAMPHWVRRRDGEAPLTPHDRRLLFSNLSSATSCSRSACSLAWR